MSLSTLCINPKCVAQATKRCAECKEAFYCSTTCQKTDWRVHKNQCKDKSIQVKAVRISSVHYDAPVKNISKYHSITIGDSHPIFNMAPTPISQTLGYPLVVWRLNTNRIHTTSPGVTWLMINPNNWFFAPMEWQDEVGDVVVARANKEALDVETLVAFSDYLWKILQTVDPTEEAQAELKALLNEESLKKYMAEHPKAQIPENFKEALLESEIRDSNSESKGLRGL